MMFLRSLLVFSTRQISFAMSSQKKDRGHDFLVFLVFLFVSSCMWLMKFAGETLEAEVSLGVVVKNMPQELQLKDDAVVRVVIKAHGADIIAYMMGGRHDMAVDYGDMEYRDGLLVMSTSRLANSAASVLPSSFSFRYFKENELVLETEQQTAILPVILSSSYVAADGLELGAVEITPKMVNVTAPAAMLNEMGYVQFGGDLPVVISGDTLISYTLEQNGFVKYDPVKFTADVRTEPYVDICVSRKVDISNACMGKAGSDSLPPVPVTVTCRVPRSMLSELGSGHLKVYVASRDASAMSGDTLRFGVSALPFFVKEECVVVEPGYVVLD